jgi:hypothetical protein
MEFPLVIIYGYRISLERVGWTARRCSRCRKAQPFECFDQWKSNHIYFIHGKVKSIGLILICNFCETSVGLAPNSPEAKALKCTRTWMRSEGFNALVEKTNPKLGYVPVSEKPGRQELFALLESANERASPYKIDAKSGFSKGSLLGALAAAILGLLLSLVGLIQGLDAFGSAFLGGFIGFFAGGILGAVKFKWDYSKQLVEELLIAAMDRHSLTLSTLERTLKQYPGKLKYVSTGLTQLASQT